MNLTSTIQLADRRCRNNGDVMRSRQFGLYLPDLLLFFLLAIPLLAIAYVYSDARADLNRSYELPPVSVEVLSDPAAITEGGRLAKIRGCIWCHGEYLEGQQYFAEADRGVIVVASNLTKKIREYTPEAFARAVRHGIRPDGTSLQPAMPSFAFYNMSDADMGLIMAYIRSLPEQEGLDGEFRLLPIGWARWALDKLPPNVAELIDHDAPRPDPAVNGPAILRGRYLAESICTECHGDNGRLRVPVTPDLEISLPYTQAEFRHLMLTGEPRHERPIDYHMVDVAKYRYGEMTAAEIDSLYEYFQSLL